MLKISQEPRAAVMNTRKLGYTDLHFSTVGLGTWAIGGGDWKFGWGPQDDAESIGAIRRALELGVNWIDTAHVYGFGHSEEIVGKAIRELKQKPIVATKCGRLSDNAGGVRASIKKESIRQECEGSLKRLQVERIDLYQIHWCEPDAELEEGWATMAELVKEGKIRFAGVCNASLAHLKRMQPIHPVASLQPPYSMLVRDIEKETLAYCAANDIGVVCYSPMQKGLLTGTFTRERIGALAPNDHRRNDPRFKEPQLSANLELVEALRPIAATYGKSVAHLAIAWTLRRPEVTSAIVGARRASQIEQTAAATDLKLPQADIDAIEALLLKRQQSIF